MRRGPAPPPSPTPVPAEGRATGVALVLAAAGYAAWASGSRPFTARADVAVSVPALLFVSAPLLQRLWPTGAPWRRLVPPRVPVGTAAPWLAVVGVVLAVELASYLHGGARPSYPTISYGLDVIARARTGRGALWFAWLCGGWFLVRR